MSEVSVMTTEKGLRELKEAEIAVIVLENEAEKAAAEAATKPLLKKPDPAGFFYSAWVTLSVIWPTAA
ncbi:hypothetical protein FRX31_006248 [Thalictrum thalictroides]|uniref:Uncharacterized protein n=1 Tax=Thalictrum thalictroides TaxID=46969 RepID=A0A7J6X333_THATH|nr:hypothetical protein FRX31_006248 [Thalictrum thalictroides]